MRRAEEEGGVRAACKTALALDGGRGACTRLNGRFFYRLSNMPNPRINPLVLLSPVEEGYVAYDPALDQLHHLNPAAALLMELCDGNRSVDDIRAMVGSLMPAGKVAEIDRWIDEATKAGLLLAEGGDAAQRRELTSAELHTLAKRLREM